MCLNVNLVQSISYYFVTGVDVITFEEWQKIDRAEVERGKEQGKLREKIVNVEDMLEVAKS